MNTCRTRGVKAMERHFVALSSTEGSSEDCWGTERESEREKEREREFYWLFFCSCVLYICNMPFCMSIRVSGTLESYVKRTSFLREYVCEGSLSCLKMFHLSSERLLQFSSVKWWRFPDLSPRGVSPQGGQKAPCCSST